MNDLYSYLIENIFRYYHEPFSTDLYKESLYGTIGFITVGSALAFNLIFYYVINRPRFARWYNWAVIGAIHILVCFFLAYFIPKDDLDEVAPNVYGFSDYLGFALINSLSAILFFVIWMLVVRWRSTNAKQTPYPH